MNGIGVQNQQRVYTSNSVSCCYCDNCTVYHSKLTPPNPLPVTFLEYQQSGAHETLC